MLSNHFIIIKNSIEAGMRLQGLINAPCYFSILKLFEMTKKDMPKNINKDVLQSLHTHFKAELDNFDLDSIDVGIPYNIIKSYDPYYVKPQEKETQF